MSVYAVDGFEFPSTPGPGNEVYTINFSDGLEEITCDYSGTDGELPAVSEGQRGKAEGEFIFSVCSISEPTKLVKIFATLNTPFAYIEFEYDSPSCTPLPPSCDLAFTSVTPTAETEQGANDGTITAVATTSYTGLEYSLNGVDWQSSGSFTGLTPGNYNVRAHDDNGCEISQIVTVNNYYNPIIGGFSGLPIVNVSSGNISRWSAAYNPIVINFQRRDFGITEVTEGAGGTILVELDAELDEDEIELALETDVVVVSEKYNLKTPALEHNVVSGVSVLTFSNIFYGTDTGLIIIDLIKPNYKVEIEITYGESPYKKQTITGQWSPNLLGITRADMAAFLKTLVNAKDEFPYNVQNWRDTNRSASYTIRYREVWDTGSGVWYNAPYPLYVVYAAMQLGDPRGGNMADYVPFYAEPNPDYKAKFMTAFIEPYYNTGLPFDLSFIFSEYLVNYDIKMRTTSLDYNRQPYGSVADQLLLNTDAGYLLTDDPNRFLIQAGSGSPVQDNDITDYLGVNRLMMAGEPADGVWYYQIQLFRGESEDPYFLTQPIIVRIARPCGNEPYAYFKWINNLGGWDYFRFGFNQVLQLNTSNETVVKRSVFNWATDDTISDVIKKSANEKLTFGVNGIEAAQIAGLKQIAKSIKVMMLVRENPIYWQTIEIIPGTFNLYETRKGIGTLTFSAKLIDNNIQQQ